MWFNFCSSLEMSTSLNSFAQSPEYYYNSCPEVVMQDAQYFSPLDVTNDLLAKIELENFMEIEPDYNWAKRGWEDEYIDIEMVDLTSTSEMILPMTDFEMYEATEKLWSLKLEDINLPWIPSDIYMVDIRQDNICEHMMSF